MKITIPDDLAETYQVMADEAHLPLETVISRQLLRYAFYPPSDRVIILDGAIREQIEQILGPGLLLNAQDLLDKVRRWAGITIGDVRLDFTPGQLEEIAARAERLGITPEEEVRRIVRRMEEQFFWSVTV